MRFTESWLREHLDTPWTPQEIAKQLTQAGLELDALVDLRQGFERISVGILESVTRHPHADRLTVCQVRVNQELLQIVCGATNHQTGDKVAVAQIGAILPNGREIQASEIRGIPSAGMLCSTTELGLTSESDGILILPPDTPVGLSLVDYLGRSDHLYEIDITPNRGDCFSVRGVARDLAARATLKADPKDSTVLRPFIPRNVAVHDLVTSRFPAALRMEDPEGCPRYTGRVISGVRIGPSPIWLQHRLEFVGLRPINNVVDVTNYVMLDLGHPLHAFDLSRLVMPMVVRRAQAGEILRTLDGQERALSPEMTVIADRHQALALAGIMGGEDSSVTPTTTDLFLEAAFFDPIRVARTGRKLGIMSESRHRFERGVDPAGLIPALELATDWILALAGGQAGPILQAEARPLPPPEPIRFRLERICRLAGIHLSQTESDALLSALGCRQVRQEADAVWYLPPSHRHDLRREEDLLEEIIRLYGYDQVPVSLPRVDITAHLPSPMETLGKDVRHAMVSLGYLEAINYAFISPAAHQLFDLDIGNPVVLRNPISTDMSHMRTTLIPGLVDSVLRNQQRGNTQLRLFEMGRIFLLQTNGTVHEQEFLAGALSGLSQERAWHSPAREADFFDLKGQVEGLLNILNIPNRTLLPGGPAFLHPGQCAWIHVNNLAEPVGWLGQIHPTVATQLGLGQKVFLFELNGHVLVAQRTVTRQQTPVSRFPAVDRDFAFILDADIPAHDIIETLYSVDRELIREVLLFDVYRGEHVPVGKKSLALKLILQSPYRTLTDEDLRELSEKLVQQMEKIFSANLRGG